MCQMIHWTILDHIPITNDIYCPDIPLERKTMEFRELNKNGKALLDLCKTVSVRIVNGRVEGDESGRFTRFPMNQNPNNSDDFYPSVLDYHFRSYSFKRD